MWTRPRCWRWVAARAVGWNRGDVGFGWRAVRNGSVSAVTLMHVVPSFAVSLRPRQLRCTHCRPSVVCGAPSCVALHHLHFHSALLHLSTTGLQAKRALAHQCLLGVRLLEQRCRLSLLWKPAVADLLEAGRGGSGSSSGGSEAGVPGMGGSSRGSRAGASSAAGSAPAQKHTSLQLVGEMVLLQICSVQPSAAAPGLLICIHEPQAHHQTCASCQRCGMLAPSLPHLPAEEEGRWQQPLWCLLANAGALPLTALVPLHALCCLLLGISFADVADLDTMAQVRCVHDVLHAGMLVCWLDAWPACAACSCWLQHLPLTT